MRLIPCRPRTQLKKLKRKGLQNQKNNIRDDCSDYYWLGYKGLL